MQRGELVLRQLSLADEESFRSSVAEWDSSPDFLFPQGYTPGMRFSDYLGLLKANEMGQMLPTGYVAQTVWEGFVNGEHVGRISIRHELTEFLLRAGGHIGYGVRPAFRKRGYAQAMLSRCLPLARQLGIAPVLVTCNDHNVGSKRVIESCGGVLENKVQMAVGGPLRCRYWIDNNLGARHSHGKN